MQGEISHFIGALRPASPFRPVFNLCISLIMTMVPRRVSVLEVCGELNADFMQNRTEVLHQVSPPCKPLEGLGNVYYEIKYLYRTNC